MSDLLTGMRDRLYWKSQPDRLPAIVARDVRLGEVTMTTLRVRQALLSAIAALALTVAPAAAQQHVPDTGGRVYGLVGGGFGDGTFIATGAGAGLRLTPRIGLDLELTHLSDRGGTITDTPWFGGVSVFGAPSTAIVAEDFPPVGIDDFLFPPVRFEDRGRDVTTFLTKFTAEFPIADGLLFPYLTGGGGVGRVTERFGVIFDPIPWLPLDHGPSTAHATSARDPGGTAYFSDFSTSFPGPSAYSELGLALVLGGGVDVPLWRGLGAGVDIRWLRVLRNYGALDTAQVTARASYRF